MSRQATARTGGQVPAQELRPGPLRGGWGAWLKDLALSVTGALVGTTLLLMPWGPGWDQNYFSGWTPGWYRVWVNPYFRGAVSGVGALNLYLVIADLVGKVQKWWVEQRSRGPNG